MSNTNDLQYYIAKKVRSYRKAKKLSQEELSEKANLGQKYINQLENQRINISIQSLDKIIQALNLTSEEFFNFSNSEELPQEKDSLALRRFFSKLKQLPSEKQENLINLFEQIFDQID